MAKRCSAEYKGEGQFRAVKAIPDLYCTIDGKFEYKGKPKAVIYCKKNFGNEKGTARLTFGKSPNSTYIQAAKCVAMAWKHGYDEQKHCITYRDNDIHNIHADNLVLCSYKEYQQFKMRNAGFHGMNLQQRIDKLNLIIEEAGLTKNYLETKDFEPINKHIKDYLYLCLMKYCKETLYLGDTVSMDIVPDCIARLYEVIMTGACIYNYERYCKKLLHNYKKKKDFGVEGNVPKPIEIGVKQLNLDCLWEKYRKSTRKN